MKDGAGLQVLATILGQSGDQRGERLAALVMACSDAVALRRFACACASHALQPTSTSTSISTSISISQRALHVLHLATALACLVYTRPVTYLHSDSLERTLQAAEHIAQELDKTSFAASDAAETGAGTWEDYQVAFRCARAADSVVCCFEASAAEAANRGCYEAYSATEDVETLLALAEQMLRR